MRILFLFIIMFLTGCESPKKRHDFTFFKWNIHESYYLKFNSSDTLYYINTYPYEEQTSFMILSDEQKEKIQNTLDTITFPNDKEYINDDVEDGESFAFYLKPKKLKLHGRRGPNQFWLFGKSLEAIKEQNEFNRINKQFDLTEINKMLFVPMPPPLIEK